MNSFSDAELQQLIDEHNLKTARELGGLVADSRCLRSLQLDCKNRNLIFPRTASATEVINIVQQNIPLVGPVYGRKTMTGFLRSQGHSIGEQRVGQALQVLAPESHQRRQVGTSRQLNPLSYHAPAFGYNAHIDQNEKLVDYGVVICGIVDGASNFLLGFNVMGHKNNLQIYDALFKPVVETFGLFDCLISDCGREFALIQFAQVNLSHMRVNRAGILSTRPPIKQLRSTENNRIERIWVMVNDRCTYPMKNLLVHLVDNGMIDLTNPAVAFAVSSVCQKVVSVLLARLRESWNHHSIPKHGKPIDHLPNSITYACVPPSTEVAVRLFEQQGGTLTYPWDVGLDDVDEDQKELRDRRVLMDIPGGYEAVANSVLADDPHPLVDAINRFLIISRLMRQV